MHNLMHPVLEMDGERMSNMWDTYKHTNSDHHCVSTRHNLCVTQYNALVARLVSINTECSWERGVNATAAIISLPQWGSIIPSVRQEKWEGQKGSKSCSFSLSGYQQQSKPLVLGCYGVEIEKYYHATPFLMLLHYLPEWTFTMQPERLNIATVICFMLINFTRDDLKENGKERASCLWYWQPIG